MALSYKARRRWALVILLIGMPAYIIVAATAVSEAPRVQNIWLAFLVSLVLGVAWIIPFRFVFRGIGQPNPDAPPDSDR